MKRRKIAESAFGVVVAIGAGMLILSGCSAGGSNQKVRRLSGGGATFVQPLIDEWKQPLYQAKGIELDYQAKGSGNGIQQMTKKTIDFGCSDAPMKKAQLEEALKEGGEVIHIPLTMGPVVPAYHLPGVDKPLVFSGPVLADIYLGKIKKWNDEAIRKLNQDAKLPDMNILPVYRAEASGTTNIFTEYLSKVSPEFKSRVGASTQPKWPAGVGTGERENSGVAAAVKSNVGAIGYVEVRHAKKNGLQYGAVINKAGKPVLGSSETVTAAAASALHEKQTEEPYSLHELTYSITNATGENAYPISGLSYCVIYKKQPLQVGTTLKEFLDWAIHAGQTFAVGLDYAPLPEELVKQIEAKLQQIELVP